VPGTKIPAVFIFATEDGTISAWAGGLNPADNAVLAADESATGAVYKGMTFAVNAKGAFLFATNFHKGTIDVFAPNGTDGMFQKVTLDGPPSPIRRYRPAMHRSILRISMATCL
jgi:6-phosphogluconolactonase (cycloisomerase 2 family)